MARLILLEDERILREELAEYFSSHGHQVATAADLAEFRCLWATQAYHIAILDLGLPDGDGMELMAALRQSGSDVGIVVLTARSQSESCVAGLAGGADHYLIKPVRLNELLATVNALARRLAGATVNHTWTLDTLRHELLAPDGSVIALSVRDYAVLHVLIDGQGRAVSRRQIVAALGDDFLAFDQRRLDTQMLRLRKKVQTQTGRELPINTVHAVGYLFAAPAVLKKPSAPPGLA